EELARIGREEARTFGEKIYKKSRVGGVRAEAAGGFVSVREAGLPRLRATLDAGLSLNDAGLCALVALMAANNETGVLQPVKEAARIAKEKGALFFTDAVQAAPYMPIDVKDWGVDMLSFSGHKFYGPKGCGVLYIRSGVKVEKLVGGGEQERGLRGGTLNVPSVVGLAAAYEKTVKEMERSNQKIRALSQLFMQEISCLKGVTRNGSGDMLPAVLNLRFEGVENTAFLYSMDLKGVALAAGSACASASVKPSHVLTAMGLTAEQAKECVRLSFGKDNTEEEIRQGARLTLETVGRLQNLH
ncbi:MAG: aminotransferase class V-fold PLP-dependent enzyme, partial [Clostridia bacterium]|nr:aminotransferase class V-fold PLP-dependent enzyme [Clostridia bacterium]